MGGPGFRDKPNNLSDGSMGGRLKKPLFQDASYFEKVKKNSKREPSKYWATRACGIAKRGLKHAETPQDLRTAIQYGLLSIRLATGTEHEADARYTLGLLLSRTNHPTLAAEQFEIALTLGCPSTGWYLSLAKTYMTLKKNEKALEALERYFKHEKNPSKQAFYIRGNAKFYSGDLAGAIADFDRADAIRALERETDDNARLPYRLYFLRGWAKARLHQHEDALPDFEKALEMKNSVGIVWGQYGILLSTLTDYRYMAKTGDNGKKTYDLEARKERVEKAIFALEEARRLKYVTCDTLLALGTLLRDRSRHSEAEECIRAAIARVDRELEKTPERIPFEKANLYLVLSDTLLSLKKYGEAIGAVRQAELLGAPKDPVAASKGLVLLEWGKASQSFDPEKIEEAEKILREAINGESASGKTYYTYACVLMQQKLYGNAIAMLEKAVKKGYSNRRVHHHLGMAYLCTAQPEKAIEEFEEYISMGGHDYLDLARAYNSGDKHQPLKALDALSKLKITEANMAEYDFECGVAYADLGYQSTREREKGEAAKHFRTAERHLQSALDSGFGRPIYCWMQLCWVYMYLKDREKMHEAFERANEIATELKRRYAGDPEWQESLIKLDRTIEHLLRKLR